MITETERRESGTGTIEHLQNGGPAYSPNVDIYVSPDAALFLVDMPGVGKGDVSIQIDETDSLIIRGKNSHSERDNPVLRQFNAGNYYRVFQLSDEYDKEKISAKLENGLLEVRVPKREEVKPRRIEITA